MGQEDRFLYTDIMVNLLHEVNSVFFSVFTSRSAFAVVLMYGTKALDAFLQLLVP